MSRAEGEFKRYLPLEVCPARQASNAASACSRSSALLSRRRACLRTTGATTGVPSLTSSTLCHRIRLRVAIRDQFTGAISHHLNARAFTAKPPERAGKPAASPYAPNDTPAEVRWGCRNEQPQEKSPIQPGNYTSALSCQ